MPTGRPAGTLVLIHAFPLTAWMWEPQLTLAAAGWRIIAPYLRGTDSLATAGGPAGAIEPPALSMDDHAADVIDLLDALHVDNAVIGGLSMGGYVTFALFRRAPRYFRGMVLADTRPQADTPEGVEVRRRMQALVAERGAEAVAEEVVPRLLGEATRVNRPDIARLVRELVLMNSPEGISAAITALIARPDSTPLLQSIHCPTLILVGDEDAITPPGVSIDMQRAIAGSELVIVPQAGHLSSLEQPATFNDAVARFLEHRV